MATGQATSTGSRHGQVIVGGGLLFVLASIVVTLVVMTMGAQLYAVLSDVVAAMS